MRRIEFSRRLEEASCGVRGELLNRGSGVRVPAPAPLFVHHFLLYSISALSPCGSPRRLRLKIRSTSWKHDCVVDALDCLGRGHVEPASYFRSVAAAHSSVSCSGVSKDFGR